MIKIKNNQRNLISVTYAHIAARVAMVYEPLLLFDKIYTQPKTDMNKIKTLTPLCINVQILLKQTIY